MTVTNKIKDTFAETPPDFSSKKSSTLYIMDYSKQTNKQRGVEWTDVEPTDITAFMIDNQSCLDITFAIFQENTKVSTATEDISHCEGVLYPTTNSDNTWLVFLELKYIAKTKQLRQTLQHAREQLFSTVDTFRSLNIIDKEKMVYCIFSVPCHSMPFTNWGTPTELQNIRSEKKVIMRPSNNMIIESAEKVNV